MWSILTDINGSTLTTRFITTELVHKSHLIVLKGQKGHSANWNVHIEEENYRRFTH